MVWLEEKLDELENNFDHVVCSFTAASNVTGIRQDMNKINFLCHSYKNVEIIWDMATAGPYVKIDLNPKLGRNYGPDIVMVSTHKFIGGPGASGVLCGRRKVFDNKIPSMPGGGTVSGVAPNTVVYEKSIENREEAGTPDILGCIRAAYAFGVKNRIGEETIEKIEESHWRLFLNIVSKHNKIKIMGNLKVKRVPVVSFQISVDENQILHYNYCAKLLNDMFGIQSRGGCMCAGPYGTRLLGISDKDADSQLGNILNAGGSMKPGFTRVNLHWSHTKAEVEFIANAIVFLSEHGAKFLHLYKIDWKTGNWEHIEESEYSDHEDLFRSDSLLKTPKKCHYTFDDLINIGYGLSVRKGKEFVWNGESQFPFVHTQQEDSEYKHILKVLFKKEEPMKKVLLKRTIFNESKQRWLSVDTIDLEDDSFISEDGRAAETIADLPTISTSPFDNIADLPPINYEASVSREQSVTESELEYDGMALESEKSYALKKTENLPKLTTIMKKKEDPTKESESLPNYKFFEPLL
eukprot:UN34114